MLINVIIPTIAGILTFMRMINVILRCMTCKNEAYTCIHLCNCFVALCVKCLISFTQLVLISNELLLVGTKANFVECVCGMFWPGVFFLFSENYMQGRKC